MIPKLIKYIWFSNDHTIPIEYEYNILYAHIQNPGYKIIIYSNDELQFQVLNDIPNIELRILENTDEHKKLNNFTIKSDYYRFEILRDGGFYFDTDILILKSLDDLLEYDSVFFSMCDILYLESSAMGFCPNNEYVDEAIKIFYDYLRICIFFNGVEYSRRVAISFLRRKNKCKCILPRESANTLKEDAAIRLLSDSQFSNYKYGLHLRSKGEGQKILSDCIKDKDAHQLSLARKVIDECNEYLKTK